jgi:hypothetical protein
MAEWDTQAIQARVVAAARLQRGSRYQTLADLLPLLDQHLRTLVVPELLRVAEDWLAGTATYSVVAGTAVYRLPSRNLRVLGVSLLGADGRPQSHFSRATAEQAKQRRAGGWVKGEGTPAYWLVESNSLRLYPTPDASGQYTLSVRYARRPGRLVDSEDSTVWVVDSFDSGTMTVYLVGTDAPSTNTPYDFVAGSPNFEGVQDDLTVTSPTTLGGGLYSAVLSDWTGEAVPQPGDYMTLAGTSPVPQVPLDYLALLEMSVEEQLLRNEGDPAAAQSMADAKVALMASASALLEPRAAENTVLVPGWDV